MSSTPLQRLLAILVCAVCGVALSALPVPAQPQRIPIPPVDDAAEDASFQAFKARLGPAMQQRDAQFLTRLVVDNRPTGFGLTPILDFFQADPCGEGLWDALARAVSLGCVRDEMLPDESQEGPRPEMVYLCPYLIASNYPESLDLFQTVVAVDDGVPVRAAPSEQAAVVGLLSHEAVAVTNTLFAEPSNATNATGATGATNATGVTLSEGCAPELWHEVQAAGFAGFVNATQVLSPVDCRFVLAKFPGLKSGEGVEGWVLQDIYCGD